MLQKVVEDHSLTYWTIWFQRGPKSVNLEQTINQ